MRKIDIATTGGFVALGCVGFICSSPAQASEIEADQERIVVTGERIEEVSSAKQTAPISDTPRTISVISEESIERSATYSLEDALRMVPGITLGAGEGGNAAADIPFLRGVDATGDIFIDGARDIGAQSRESFAVQSIEVYKGASGAFGGRGGAAGAINMVSKLARPGNSVEGQATVGTSDLVRLTGDVNSELSDQIAVRAVGMFHDSMVPGRNSVSDDRWGIAPSVTFGLKGPLAATLAYYHLETDGIPDYGIPLTSRRQINPDADTPDVRKAADVSFDNFYGLLDRDFQKTNVDALTGIVKFELTPEITLSNTTRYNWVANDYIVTNPDDSAGNVANGNVWRAVKSRNSRSEGIVSNFNVRAGLNTGSVRHELAGGFEYSDTRSTNLPYSVDTGDRACPATEFANSNCTSLLNPDPTDAWTGSITAGTQSVADAEDYSFYLFDTLTISDKLLLNGGIRWTHFTASAAGVSRGVAYDESTSGSFMSYQAGVVYKPVETVSLYLSYADSKTPPGTTVGEGQENLGSANALYEPQATSSWEAGAKVQAFGEKLLLSGALFRIERDNIQERDPTGEVTEILDSARLQGLELSASGVVGPVTMLIGYTFIDSELGADAAAVDDDPTTISNQGNALPQTSRHNFAATVNWQITPQLSVGGGAYGSSKRYADPANLISAPGYVRFDANVQYQINDNFGLRVNVNNVTDKRYIAKLRNPHFAVPADGRQALLTLTARY